MTGYILRQQITTNRGTMRKVMGIITMRGVAEWWEKSSPIRDYIHAYIDDQEFLMKLKKERNDSKRINKSSNR